MSECVKASQASVVVWVMFFIGLIAGIGAEGCRMRREAVQSGHAEYVTKDGEPVWQWKAIKGETTGEQ